MATQTIVRVIDSDNSKSAEISVGSVDDIDILNAGTRKKDAHNRRTEHQYHIHIAQTLGNKNPYF